MDASIASAVMLPEPQEPESPQAPALSPTGLKRRQSSISEQDAKRARLNSIDANVPRRSSTTANDASATTSGRRERGRERRLFGAALGALSQNSATPAQKRRSEIEKRQQAQRKLEEQESDQRKLERDVRRRDQRLEYQKVFENESMRVRHANLLNMAHFLRTETEPQLYYKPWETSQDENAIIEAQITDAKEIIARELEQYEHQQEDSDEPDRHASRHGDANGDAGAGTFSSGKEPNAEMSQQHSAANGATNDSEPLPKDLEPREDHALSRINEAVSDEPAASHEQESRSTSHEAAEPSKDMDDNGEEIVEAAEDTVIY
ncbi:hypothetical protein CC78DRAFT_193047 [Lojkania enalia]|uniref:Pinin/SDK/MemA protein domain-containing protein n=1 Tax=Lojkania enalia TaxID=147567 RepID=A0A9P4NBM5_9PLEO|nr:hypothetical protein CC78DRAFT_193047 [Didymosphaeria enalia]